MSRCHRCSWRQWRRCCHRWREKRCSRFDRRQLLHRYRCRVDSRRRRLNPTGRCALGLSLSRCHRYRWRQWRRCCHRWREKRSSRFDRRQLLHRYRCRVDSRRRRLNPTGRCAYGPNYCHLHRLSRHQWRRWCHRWREKRSSRCCHRSLLHRYRYRVDSRCCHPTDRCVCALNECRCHRWHRRQ